PLPEIYTLSLHDALPICLIDEVARGLAVDLGVEEVGVLGGGVVAPDRHVGDRRDLHAGLRRDLRLGPVVVETGHRGEAFARDRPDRKSTRLNSSHVAISY